MAGRLSSARAFAASGPALMTWKALGMGNYGNGTGTADFGPSASRLTWMRIVIECRWCE